MKSTKSTVYNSFTSWRLQFVVPLCHEDLVPLLPVCAFDPFSWFQNSILSQMKTYSCTFFREIWLLHRSYSTKLSHNPVFPLPVERKCALPLKVYSQNKNAVRTQNNGIMECFRLFFASALSSALSFPVLPHRFFCFFTPCFYLFSIYPFFPLPWHTPPLPKKLRASLVNCISKWHSPPPKEGGESLLNLLNNRAFPLILLKFVEGLCGEES